MAGAGASQLQVGELKILVIFSHPRSMSKGLSIPHKIPRLVKFRPYPQLDSLQNQGNASKHGRSRLFRLDSESYKTLLSEGIDPRETWSPRPTNEFTYPNPVPNLPPRCDDSIMRRCFRVSRPTTKCWDSGKPSTQHRHNKNQPKSLKLRSVVKGLVTI